ncbi:MAG: hypothetical protein CL916_09855 [Deltaproteobacteria bacterium]|nr:hypothetical protein [Deltaproteobacteria bacterium]
MRILIVHHHHLPKMGHSVTGEGLRVQQLHDGLCAQGHHVSLLSGGASSPSELLLLCKDIDHDCIIAMHVHLMPILAKLEVPLILDLYAQRLMESQFESNTLETTMALIHALRYASLIVVSNDRQRWSWHGVLSMLGVQHMPEPIIVVPLQARPCGPRNPPEKFRLIGGGMDWPWQNPKPNLQRALNVFEQRGEGEIIWFGNPKERIEHPRIQYKDHVSYEAYRRELLCASAAFDWMEPNIEREFAIAFRHMDFVGCGLPILTGRYSPLPSFLHEGCWISDDLEEVLHDIMGHPHKLEEASKHLTRSLDRLSSSNTTKSLHSWLLDSKEIQWSHSPLVEPAQLWHELLEEKKINGTLIFANQEYDRDRQKKSCEISELHHKLAEHITTIANLSRSISDVVAYRKEAMIVLGGQIEQHSKTAEDLTTENAILRADIAKKSAELEAMDQLRSRLENDIQALREEVEKKKTLWRR